MNKKPFKVQGSRLNVRCMSDDGFTMVELLVSAGLSLFVLGVVYSVYRVQTRTVKSQESRSIATEDARTALDLMVREIRNAGYNPRDTVNGASCAGGGPGTPGVVTANATTFRFTYDFRDGTVPIPGPADGDCNDPNEDITYAFATAGCAAGFGDITRTDNNTPPAAPQPISNCNIPSPGGVPGTNFEFKYFPQNSIVELPAPVALASIQRVLISLTVRSASPDTEFGGGQLSAAMVSNVDLRNRGAK